MAKLYKNRSSAHRAAKAALKKIFGERFCAQEGPDYHILPDCVGYFPEDRRFKYVIVHAEAVAT